MDMVRSMTSNSTLTLSLWSEVLKMAAYILNRVATKVVPKIPFELRNGWKPSLGHVHIWGCLVEVRIYNPLEKKFDLKKTNGFLFGYVERSKGFKFYFPARTPCCRTECLGTAIMAQIEGVTLLPNLSI